MLKLLSFLFLLSVFSVNLATIDGHADLKGESVSYIEKKFLQKHYYTRKGFSDALFMTADMVPYATKCLLGSPEEIILFTFLPYALYNVFKR